MRYALDHAELRAPLLVNVLVGALAFNFMITVTAMVRLTLGGGASAAGAAHALNAAGAVLGSLLIASLERPPSRSALALACCAVALTTSVNALAPSLLSFLLWAPFFGFSVGAYQTSLLSSVQHATEPRMLGRVSALLTLGTVGMTPIASLIAGALIDRWSVRVAMGLGATACMAGALLLARLPRPAADRSAA
jgi:MFS family permease